MMIYMKRVVSNYLIYFDVSLAIDYIAEEFVWCVVLFFTMRGFLWVLQVSSLSKMGVNIVVVHVEVRKIKEDPCWGVMLVKF